MSMEKPVDPIIATYRSLLRISPGKRVIAGLACIAGGGALALLLRGKSIIWGLPLFVLAAGVFLFIPGFLDLRNQSRRRKCRESIREREEAVIRGMLAAKRRGKNPLQWLKEEGIHDAEIRAELLRKMSERWRSAGGNARSG